MWRVEKTAALGPAVHGGVSNVGPALEPMGPKRPAKARTMSSAWKNDSDTAATVADRAIGVPVRATSVGGDPSLST